MNLFETLKRTFLKQPELPTELKIHPEKNIQDLSSDNDIVSRYLNFFDGNVTGLSQHYRKVEVAQEQKDKIETYRMISKYPEVSDAIDEIVNEIIYTPNFKDIIQIKLDEIDNKPLSDKIKEKFDKIYKLMRLNNNLFNIVRTSYIDGQINVLVEYGNNKEGINKISYIDPRYLIFDENDKKIKYIDLERDKQYSGMIDIENSWNIEEIVHQNYGIFKDNGVILSYLEKSIKVANQLKTLEDLLIPLRFSRSVSRRVFNVDVSDLPNSKAEAFMRKIQELFKYKKFYNSETGEVTNQQHITSLVEDYWFANRNGQKGTQVDLLDESGNLGELGDILYFYKKLYKSLGIPTNRIYLDNDQQPFDFESSQISQEDIRFQMLISRIRKVYSDFFLKLLKLELIYCGIIKESEFDNIKDNIVIYFTGENQFLERMNLNIFMKKLDGFQQAREFAGKVLPVSLLFQEIFKYDEEQIKEMLTLMQKEENNPLFKHFYPKEEELEM